MKNRIKIDYQKLGTKPINYLMVHQFHMQEKQ